MWEAEVSFDEGTSMAVGWHPPQDSACWKKFPTLFVLFPQK